MRLQFLALALALTPFVPQDDAKREAPSMPEVGKPAPAFRLNDHAGEAVGIGRKSDTWTVLAFFPKAATPG